jgi:subtilase family serine protease
MKIKTFVLSGLAGCLAVALTVPATAQIVNIGGTPSPGHARPPLFINFGPFKGPGAGPAATSVYYSPAQIRQAYGFDQLTANGSGQIIAIVDAYGSSTIQSDLDTFCAQFGIAGTTVAIYNPQNSRRSNTGWAEETSLDVEWAHAIAPKATIALVIAKSSSFSDLLNAVDYAVNTVGANVVSMSWGGSESSGETSYDSHFNHPGVTFVASAGDSGEGAEYPAASPYVVSVGGTSLILDGNNARSSETAWSGSGGGISGYELAPSWQSAWSRLSYRGVPDVSYVADPNTGVEVVYNGGLYVFGGTSVGAPQWAALVALSKASLSSADAALYSVAGTPNTIDSSYFYDITSGNNGPDADDYAIPGYDLATGLGSPAAAGVVPALAGWSPAPPSPDFTVGVSPASQSVNQGSEASYTVTVSALNGYAETVNLTGTATPSGVTGNFSPSSVNVSSSTPGTATLTIPTTSSTATGTYSLTITGTDTTGSPTHSVGATLVVTSSSTATAMSVSSITYSAAGPNLQITVAVVDNLGNPVPNVSVSITLDLNGSPYVSGSGTTGSNGQVTFVLHHAPSGTYTTVVTTVTASGLTWDGITPPNSYP